MQTPCGRCIIRSRLSQIFTSSRHEVWRALLAVLLWKRLRPGKHHKPLVDFLIILYFCYFSPWDFLDTLSLIIILLSAEVRAAMVFVQAPNDTPHSVLTHLSWFWEYFECNSSVEWPRKGWVPNLFSRNNIWHHLFYSPMVFRWISFVRGLGPNFVFLMRFRIWLYV